MKKSQCLRGTCTFDFKFLDIHVTELCKSEYSGYTGEIHRGKPQKEMTVELADNLIGIMKGPHPPCILWTLMEAVDGAEAVWVERRKNFVWIIHCTDKDFIAITRVWCVVEIIRCRDRLGMEGDKPTWMTSLVSQRGGGMAGIFSFDIPLVMLISGNDLGG